MKAIGILAGTIGLLLAGCEQPDAQRDQVPDAYFEARKVPEIELLEPADEAALKIPSACRFFKAEHWVNPLALVSPDELGFKRGGKIIRLRRNTAVQPNSLNEGQIFYHGSGYSARTVGLAETSKSFGLNIQADDESRVLIGRYGVLRCPKKR